MNLIAIADALTKLTGTNWFVLKDRNENEQLTRGDGLQLWTRAGGYGNEGRVAISFDRPNDARGQYMTLWNKAGDKVSDPRITVSADKTPEQVAKDIARRVLPDAEKVFVLANESINLHNKFETDREWAIKKIAFHCGGEPARHYQTKELTGEIDPFTCAGLPSFKGNGYGKFKVSGKDCISLELNSMGIDAAIEIADAIHAIFKKYAAKA